MTHTVIQTGDKEFKVLRIASQCAYGSFQTREEAEAAIKESTLADQLARCGQ